MVSSAMVLGSMLAPSIRGSFCNDLIFCCGYSFHDALFDDGSPVMLLAKREPDIEDLETHIHRP